MKKLNNNLIFCIFVVLLAVLIAASGVLGGAERRMHEDNYKAYITADRLYDEDRLDEALRIYTSLIPVYPKSYVLEYKAAMCEYYMDNYASAITHGLTTLELYPIIVEDAEYLEFMRSCFELAGDEINAGVMGARLRAIGHRNER